MEDGVESNVFETGNALGFAQIIAVALAQAQDGPPGSKHFFPKVWERMRRSCGVNLDGFRNCLRMSSRLRVESLGTQRSEGATDQKQRDT